MIELFGRDLTDEVLALEQLYLDPNNPRLVGLDHTPYSRTDALSEQIQDSLRSTIKKSFGIGPLMDSMENSGYLPIDRIVVQPIVEEEAYVVLEGNRRIAAAKELVERNEDGAIELNDEVLESLLAIRTMVYTGKDPNAAWIFQGIRHISGIKDWPAYNKARVLVEQMEENDLNFRDAGKLFGLTSYAAGQYVRGYYAFEQAREHPDFDDDVDERAFPFFQELFGRSNIPLREWLKWDDDEYKFIDNERLAEFLGWLYPKFDEATGEYDAELPGDWDSRRIARAIDLRKVSELLSDFKDEFQSFRAGKMTPEAAVARGESRTEKDTETTEELLSELQDYELAIRRLPYLELQESDEAAGVVDALTGIARAAEKGIGMLEPAGDANDS